MALTRLACDGFELAIFAIWMFDAAQHETPTYDGKTAFPVWAVLLGWAVAASSLLPIPVWAAWAIAAAEGSPKQV